MLLLITNHAPLGPDRKVQALKGVGVNCRECHGGGRFLPIDQVDDSAGPVGSINFVRVGAHAELFL